MSQTSKIILVAIVAALIGGGGVYLWQSSDIVVVEESPPVSTQEEELNEPEVITEVNKSNEWEELVGNNCELSGGSFSNGTCICPLEGNQTQEKMYDKSTGYCQTSFGGPGGDAFFASIGLPYGYYSFWRDIVFNQCEATGGWISGAACICPENTSYDKSDGQCKSE